ncbi:molybdopterin oxidoreductase family protein, partial [Vibrio parahaemolyticus VP-48]
NVRTTRCETVI